MKNREIASRVPYFAFFHPNKTVACGSASEVRTIGIPACSILIPGGCADGIGCAAKDVIIMTNQLLISLAGLIFSSDVPVFVRS